MKRFYIIILIAFSLFSVFSGSIDNNISVTAGYLRTLNRNAVEDSNDAIIYNPAATAYFEEGIYLSTGYKIFNDHITYNETFGYTADTEREQEILPYFSFAMKFDESPLCFFASIYSPGGKGKFIYEDFNNNIGEYLEVYREYYSSVLGFSYAPFNSFSVSLGIRAISGAFRYYDSFNGGTWYDGHADNMSPVIAFQLKVLDKMNFTLRYEHRTELSWDTDNTGIQSSENRDFPAAIYLGFGYKVNDSLRFEASYNTYLIRDADWNGYESQYDNGVEAGLAAEYRLNKMILLSAGVLFSETGEKFQESVNIRDTCYIPTSNNISIAFGTELSLHEDWSIDIGITRIFYDKVSARNDFTAYDYAVEREAWEFAVGFNCRF